MVLPWPTSFEEFLLPNWRRRAYQASLSLRKQRAASARITGQLPFSSGAWTPLGPVPLASDASGNGTEDYGYVSGRATAVAIDTADPQGNIVYIGGAPGGIWKSTNAANPDRSTAPDAGQSTVVTLVVD